MHRTLWSFFSTFTLYLCFASALYFKCAPRDYNNGADVCVCNSTYCDTVEPFPGNLAKGHFFISSSDKGGGRFETEQEKCNAQLEKIDLVLKLQPHEKYQKVIGFGGAFTDSACLNIKSISEGAQDNLMRSYYGCDGIEYGMGRVPIAATDFSTRSYSYDETPGDMNLAFFELADEDTYFKIPLIKKAKELSKKGLKLICAPWSAPKWMKTNNNDRGFGFLKPEYYQTWCDYLLRFMEEYSKHDVKYWGISTGNQPSTAFLILDTINCMGWTAESQSVWIKKYMGPTLCNSLYNETLLLAFDDQRINILTWMTVIYEDNETAPNVAGAQVHFYTDALISPLVLDKVHSLNPEKQILQTEACITSLINKMKAVSLGSWENGEKYGENIIQNLNHWVSCWLDWNIALNLNGGPNWVENYVDSPIIVNKTANEFYKQPMYYVLGHFSKYVPEGSIRILLTGATQDVDAVALLRPDKYIVVVVLNKKTEPVSISIQGGSRGCGCDCVNFIAKSKSINTLIL